MVDIVVVVIIVTIVVVGMNLVCTVDSLVVINIEAVGNLNVVTVLEVMPDGVVILIGSFKHHCCLAYGTG